MQRLHNIHAKSAAFVLSFFAACLIYTTAAQSPAATGVDSIRQAELRKKLTYIASEKFKGRGNGTPELDMAAEYIAELFQQNGLKPASDTGSFYQHFDIYSSRLGPNNSLRIRGAGDGVLIAGVRSDFVPELWSESGSIDAPVVLVEDPQAAMPDLKGKIAVTLEDRLVSDDPEIPASAKEARRLESAGAAAVIVVQDLDDRSRYRIGNLAEGFRDDLPVRLTAMSTLGIPDYPRNPVIVLSSETGRQLVAALRGPRAAVQASLSVDVERDVRRTQNVLGLIEGSDPFLKNEVMVIGAHYDHDGEADGQIWYGADDNGSGISALLELAEAFGNGPKPARSILLSAWAGEEKGLLGSRYYAGRPVFPLDRTVAMFQMDMIGRNEEHPANKAEQIPDERAADNANSVNVLGSAFSPDLRNVISRLNSQTNLNVRFRYDFGAEDLLRRSDQWTFLKRGIPAVFFFAGLHPDYHTPRDTPEKINYPKLERVAQLVYLSAFEIANQKARPAYQEAQPPR